MKALTKTGLLLALAAAPLAMTGCSTLCDGGNMVKCGGVNACKGMGKCQTPNNSCKSSNRCKGMGWVHLSAEDCAAQGGKVLE